MLGDELENLKNAVAAGMRPFSGEQYAPGALAEEGARIRRSWQAAVFSDASDHTLKRYFQQHLTGLVKLCDDPGGIGHPGSCQPVLLELIRHLQQDYAVFFACGEAAPLAYHEDLLEAMAGKLRCLKGLLAAADAPAPLRKCLLGYLAEMAEPSTTARYSFRSLSYFSEWAKQLSAARLGESGAEERLNGLLYPLNFNQLGYFVYLRNKLIAAGPDGMAQLLQSEKFAFLFLPVRPETAYDDKWPSLEHMAATWRREIFVAPPLKEGIQTVPGIKMPLQLPVAHLAFLVRLFYEESQLPTTSLTAIFKFISGHFSTKRQPAISHGSLSKEFYSTDQQTAARVRGLLQRMITRINRSFFPVLVVANAIIGVLAGK
ncbi:hypothetical protein [Mucilaginibacter sp.]|uniref:hypothetical protein n=1 Tax=Mucilaginibacter sp. TaxID=1882438 RepID=UPI003263632F